MADYFAPISMPPEAHSSFRRGQLLVLLEQFEEPLSLDRLGYLEFFAANPYLVMRSERSQRAQLRLVGFNPRALSYQATTERYANRRSRLRSDLGALSAWGYIEISPIEGRTACQLTEIGRQRAGTLVSLYAEAYRLSVSLIRPKMRNITDTALAKQVQQWLRLGDLRIDLLDTDFDFEADLQGRLL
jgi:hypothetical protein